MDPRELKDAAAEHFRKGRFGKAAEAYLSLSKVEPKEPQHLIKLGDSYRREGRKPQAVDAYRGAVDAYAKQGVMIKAIAACKLILEIDSTQKDAQEALAKLCAKRYVKRPDMTGSPSLAPQPSRGGSHEIPEALDLPEDDSPLEIEGRETEKDNSPGSKSKAPSPPDRPLPPLSRPSGPSSRPPVERAERPPVLERQSSEVKIGGRQRDPEPIEFDDGPPSVPPPVLARLQLQTKRVDPPKHQQPESIELDEEPLPPVRAPAPREEVPSEIDLDLDMGTGPIATVPKPPPAARPAIDFTDSEDLALELAAAAMSGEDDIEDAIIEEPELLLGDGEADFALAQSAEEREVIKAATTAAQRPSTAMSRILAKASRQDDEIELFAVTTSSAQPAPANRIQPSVPAASLDDYLGTMPGLDLSSEEAAGRTPVTAPMLIVPTSRPPETREVTEVPAAAVLLPAEVDQSQVPLFSELPHEAFLELLERTSFHRVAAGEVILREGDEGKSIFILASGSARVVKANGTEAPIELATLPDGAFFGEMALLNGSPRVASVIAIDDCEILEITEAILRELTVKHPSVGQSLKKFYRQRLLQNVMAISPLFRAFDTPDRRALVEKFKVREVKTNDAIITEGQAPDGLYVVMHGAALVQKKDPKTSRMVPLAALKEGDVFGEMSLLTKKPASASVVARRRTLVLRLPKPVFDELMFTHPAVLEVVSELSDQRTRVNEMILAGNAQESRDTLAFL